MGYCIRVTTSLKFVPAPPRLDCLALIATLSLPRPVCGAQIAMLRTLRTPAGVKHHVMWTWQLLQNVPPHFAVSSLRMSILPIRLCLSPPSTHPLPVPPLLTLRRSLGSLPRDLTFQERPATLPPGNVNRPHHRFFPSCNGVLHQSDNYMYS